MNYHCGLGILKYDNAEYSSSNVSYSTVKTSKENYYFHEWSGFLNDLSYIGT